ncbi:hypothetical protein Tco_1543666 [Tanacetum coccineum]
MTTTSTQQDIMEAGFKDRPPKLAKENVSKKELINSKRSHPATHATEDAQAQPPRTENETYETVGTEKQSLLDAET